MYNDDDRRENEEDYMRALYLRFRGEVDSGAAIDYYELNELLDIYDYAQDEGDVMVQMFVFLTVARLYPQSRDFDERMGFFLSYISQTSAEDMLARKGRTDSALWDVLAMGVKCYPGGDPEPYLRDILEKYKSLDCETVLKIVDLIRDMNRPQLLAKYYDALVYLAEEPNGLSFEIAEILKDIEELRNDARRIAEDLTKLEPFNIEAWLLLARIEFSLEHPEEALAAVDYALAIDPENKTALLTRAVIMVVIPEKREEAIALLKEFHRQDASNLIAIEGLAEAYTRAGEKKLACDIYKEIIEGKVYTSDPMLAILEMEPENPEEYFAFYLQKGSAEESDWRDRAYALVDRGKYAIAARMLDFYHRNVGFKTRHNVLLYCLYDACMFDRFIEVFIELSTLPEGPCSKPGFFSATDYLLLSAAYLRTGRFDEAKQLCRALCNRKEKTTDVAETLKWRGITLTAKLIESLASVTPDEEGRLPDYSGFDPLTSSILS